METNELLIVGSIAVAIGISTAYFVGNYMDQQAAIEHQSVRLEAKQEAAEWIKDSRWADLAHWLRDIREMPVSAERDALGVAIDEAVEDGELTLGEYNAIKQNYQRLTVLNQLIAFEVRAEKNRLNKSEKETE